MAKTILKTIGYVATAGQRTRKRSGFIVQSVRMLATDNQLLRRAAKAEGYSINGYANLVLMRAVNRALKTKKTEKTIG